MHFDFIILGQGIAGTLLSFELMEQGKSVLVIDRPQSDSTASVVAGAVLNPMANKRWELSKTARLHFPVAVSTYQRLQQFINESVLIPKQIMLFMHNVDEIDSYRKQQLLYPSYLAALDTLRETNAFAAEFTCGMVNHVWKVENIKLLTGYRNQLIANGQFIEEDFDFNELQIERNKIIYKNITSDKIVFCEGAVAQHNPLFTHMLPFTKNRGDVLILKIADLSANYIYEGSTRLIHWQDDLFWCGSNYNWNFQDMQPDIVWRSQIENQLNHWLALDYQVQQHWVAERPTTKGQQPILRQHPLHASVSMFNGLGTRGFSSGPYWAKAMADLLTHK